MNNLKCRWKNYFSLLIIIWLFCNIQILWYSLVNWKLKLYTNSEKLMNLLWKIRKLIEKTAMQNAWQNQKNAHPSNALARFCNEYKMNWALLCVQSPWNEFFVWNKHNFFSAFLVHNGNRHFNNGVFAPDSCCVPI